MKTFGNTPREELGQEGRDFLDAIEGADNLNDVLEEYQKFAGKKAKEQPLDNEQLTEYAMTANAAFALITERIAQLENKLEIVALILKLELESKGMESGDPFDVPDIPSEGGLVN